MRIHKGERTMYMDINNIPIELADRRQWVTWKKEARNGKPTKIPYDPKSDRRAKTNDGATWADFHVAQAACQNMRCNGLGFVFTAKDPFCGIDLDKCIDPVTGKPEEWAQEIVNRLDSYSEISPSGTGLHVILKGKLPEGWRRTEGVEVYDSGRYFCMTGQVLSGAARNIEDRQKELIEFHTKKSREGSGEQRRIKKKSTAQDDFTEDDFTEDDFTEEIYYWSPEEGWDISEEKFLALFDKKTLSRKNLERGRTKPRTKDVG